MGGFQRSKVERFSGDADVLGVDLGEQVGIFAAIRNTDLSAAIYDLLVEGEPVQVLDRQTPITDRRENHLSDRFVQGVRLGLARK